MNEERIHPPAPSVTLKQGDARGPSRGTAGLHIEVHLNTHMKESTLLRPATRHRQSKETHGAQDDVVLVYT